MLYIDEFYCHVTLNYGVVEGTLNIRLHEEFSDFPFLLMLLEVLRYVLAAYEYLATRYHELLIRQLPKSLFRPNSHLSTSDKEGEGFFCQPFLLRWDVV